MARTRRIGRGLLAAWAVLAVAASAACAASVEWAVVPEPDGSWAGLSAVAGDSDTVLAAVSAEGGPRLVRVDADGKLSEAPTQAADGYGRDAALIWLSPTDDGLVAVGGARGGAHANVRWTAWRGDVAGRLVQQAQSFETFGGWDAGALTGVGLSAEGPVIVGSWRGRVGLDIALWTPQGERWVRRETPAELANDEGTLRTASGVGSLGGEMVLVGNENRLSGVGQVPVAWLAGTAAGPWRRYELPGGAGRATAVACGAWCLVAGQDLAGSLTLWRFDGTGARAIATAPISLIDSTQPPLVAAVGDRAWVAVSGANGPVLLEAEGASARPIAAPSGTPIAAAAVRGRLYLATRSDDGPIRLWSRHVAVP